MLRLTIKFVAFFISFLFFFFSSLVLPVYSKPSLQGMWHVVSVYALIMISIWMLGQLSCLVEKKAFGSEQAGHC